MKFLLPLLFLIVVCSVAGRKYESRSNYYSYAIDSDEDVKTEEKVQPRYKRNSSTDSPSTFDDLHDDNVEGLNDDEEKDEEQKVLPLTDKDVPATIKEAAAMLHCATMMEYTDESMWALNCSVKNSTAAQGFKEKNWLVQAMQEAMGTTVSLSGKCNSDGIDERDNTKELPVVDKRRTSAQSLVKGVKIIVNWAVACTTFDLRAIHIEFGPSM